MHDFRTLFVNKLRKSLNLGREEQKYTNLKSSPLEYEFLLENFTKLFRCCGIEDASWSRHNKCSSKFLKSIHVEREKEREELPSSINWTPFELSRLRSFFPRGSCAILN